MASKLIGYFRGFTGTGNAIGTIPASVTHINLFVAGITPDGKSLATHYLTKGTSQAEMLAAIPTFQARGQRVSMSLMDSATIHWNQTDIAAYVQNVQQVAMTQWGLNGIDVDAESGMPADVYVDTMVNLVTSLRSALGSDALLTYTAYTLGMKVLGMGPDSNFDAKILPKIADSIDWVNTMGYFWDTQDQQTAFAAYAALVGPEKVAMGVGVDYQGGASTPLDEVAALAAWQPDVGSKAGMMLYALDGDAEQFTGQPDWTWVNTLASNLANARSKVRPAIPKPHRRLPWVA